MTAERRKLTAVDDPLELGPEPPPVPATRSAPQRSSDQLPALFVRLPQAESDALARAAFELKLHKRELVPALIARYVAPTPDGLAALRALVDEHRRIAG